MQNKLLITTPLGKVEWFNLVKEDKFGNYSCNLVIEDSPEMHKFKAQIDGLGSTGRLPYKVDQEGKLILKLKLKSQGQKKTGETYIINPPVIYSGVGQKLSTADVLALNVGNGSQVKAKVELAAYEFMGQAGVSCKPKAVMLVKVETFTSGEVGFDESEFTGGFEAEEIVPTATTSSDF